MHIGLSVEKIFDKVDMVKIVFASFLNAGNRNACRLHLCICSMYSMWVMSCHFEKAGKRQ